MENSNQAHVMGIPVLGNKVYGIDDLQDSTSYASFRSGGIKRGPVDDQKTKVGKKGRGKFAQGIKEHVTTGPKLSETVKGKLSLGARILQAGGVEKAFRQSFSIEKEEKLLKASQCYLSTTAGPIAGMLFISTQKIAFRSDRSLRLTSSNGDVVRVPYKVVVPLRKIKKINQSENIDNPDQKYIQIVTLDAFEFWFMGFVSYQKAFRYMEEAIQECQ